MFKETKMMSIGCQCRLLTRDNALDNPDDMTRMDLESAYKDEEWDRKDRLLRLASEANQKGKTSRGTRIRPDSETDQKGLLSGALLQKTAVGSGTSKPTDPHGVSTGGSNYGSSARALVSPFAGDGRSKQVPILSVDLSRDGSISRALRIHFKSLRKFFLRY